MIILIRIITFLILKNVLLLKIIPVIVLLFG